MTTKLIEFMTNTAAMSYKRMTIALLMSALMSIYIFFVYRAVTKSAFYSKSYNITMAIMSVVTTSVVVAMQSNLVVSLGMVGALSIVRFRTAIKDPMDLLFLFWSIGVGIITGTELYGLALILSILVTFMFLLLDFVPVKNPPYLLIVNSEDKTIKEDVMKVVDQYSKSSKIKSQNITKRGMDMVVELRTSESKNMVNDLSELELSNVSLLSHDGEKRF